MPEVEKTLDDDQLLIVGNFVEVFLAKEGHDGIVREMASSSSITLRSR
jgi:hypothetical protein